MSKCIRCLCAKVGALLSKDKVKPFDSMSASSNANYHPRASIKITEKAKKFNDALNATRRGGLTLDKS